MPTPVAEGSSGTPVGYPTACAALLNMFAAMPAAAEGVGTVLVLLVVTVLAAEPAVVVITTWGASTAELLAGRDTYSSLVLLTASGSGSGGGGGGRSSVAPKPLSAYRFWAFLAFLILHLC